MQVGVEVEVEMEAAVAAVVVVVEEEEVVVVEQEQEAVAVLVACATRATGAVSSGMRGSTRAIAARWRQTRWTSSIECALTFTFT